MHKILRVRFLLKFTHFLLGLRCRSGLLFLFRIGEICIFRTALRGPMDMDWLPGRKPSTNTNTNGSRPNQTESNNPCGNAKMRKCENVQCAMCTLKSIK